MSATTITRTTWTDLTTIVNNAALQAIYDKIDALLAANLVLGGTLTAEGYGTQTFSAGGAGDQEIFVRNTTNGAASRAGFRFGNNADASLGQLLAYAASYTTSGPEVANGIMLRSLGAGGMSLVVNDAAATIRFFGAGSVLRATLQAAGTWTWAAYGAGTLTTDASGNITAVSDERFKDRIAPLPYGLVEVLKLRPVQHGYNELSGLERKHLYGGFLAQDVQQVMPLAVGSDSRGYLTLADRPILGAVVNAVQDHEARIATLEARLNG